MSAIVVCGNLMNKEQLSAKSHLFAEAFPIFVRGYRWVFNQEPLWRQGCGKERAVLNVVNVKFYERFLQTTYVDEHTLKTVLHQIR